MFVAKYDCSTQNPYLIKNPFAPGLTWGPDKSKAWQFNTAQEAVAAGREHLPDQLKDMAVYEEVK